MEQLQETYGPLYAHALAWKKGVNFPGESKKTGRGNKFLRMTDFPDL